MKTMQPWIALIAAFFVSACASQSAGPQRAALAAVATGSELSSLSAEAAVPSSLSDAEGAAPSTTSEVLQEKREAIKQGSALAEQATVAELGEGSLELQAALESRPEAEPEAQNEAEAAPAAQNEVEAEPKPNERLGQNRRQPSQCSYQAYAWNTKTRSANAHYSVRKPYADLSADERDPNDPRCTLCVEDQVSIDPKQWGFKASSFKVCYVYAELVANALEAIAAQGKKDIDKIEGYRPGRTRGKVDAQGLRTEWSNHSFGTAIDINPHRNGLYNTCGSSISGSRQDVARCKLSIGGAYEPERFPRLSILKNDDIYKAFSKFWRWGGEISGQVKDIMHFSLTGY